MLLWDTNSLIFSVMFTILARFIAQKKEGFLVHYTEVCLERAVTFRERVSDAKRKMNEGQNVACVELDSRGISSQTSNFSIIFIRSRAIQVFLVILIGSVTW